ncbi:pyridoxamine 5'-phosphate oxidase family protein [Streptomyces sp. ZAF1911]|uniref:pyridoxamine 5'-phosphate oxidase family protein n=1 Tax=unclassified Streptomyces TaxID=2593676 RepID=UPI00237BF4BD|nr:pyridoxamine 5'-phosphate oxidase family protein [Streptomyces sp. ZAF1911]MDD9379740.1 pyridoxamine 5'-phosphate oxidase family protein [Streptomyces sp. ZAF1911]
MEQSTPRTTEQRRKDALARFESDIDVWVATADAEGVATLVPLSFRWDGETFLLSTGRTLPTGRNLAASGRARLAFGATRDVVLVEGAVTRLEAAELAPGEIEAFAAHSGFDPSGLKTPYPYFRVTPVWIQAWREADEIAGRDLMKAGRWLP